MLAGGASAHPDSPQPACLGNEAGTSGERLDMPERQQDQADREGQVARLGRWLGNVIHHRWCQRVAVSSITAAVTSLVKKLVGLL